MKSALLLGILLLSLSVNALDQQVETTPAGTEYLIYLPSTYDGSTPFPLLIYLHGAQAIDASINKSLNKGLPRVIRLNSWFANYPMIVVSPHLKDDPMVPNNDQEWDSGDVDEVITHIINTYNIDTDRISGSGISLGAKGIWDYALDYPTRFAGLVPISGNTELTNMCSLLGLGLLAVHGERDNTMLMSGTKDGIRFGPVDAIAELESCSGTPLLPPHLIALDGKSHGGWDEIYDLSSGYDIYEWMLMVEKGVSTNYQPMINLGDDQSIILPTHPFNITSFTMDPNGSITNYNWTQLSGPAISFTNGNPDLSLNFTQVGTYQFRLTVTDDESLTNSDDIQIDVVSTSSLPAVTGFTLINADDQSVVGTLFDGAVISFESLGTEDIDIEAAVANLGTRASVRLLINSNRNFNTTNDGGTFYSYAGERSNPPGEHLAFTPTLGTNILTGTAYQDRNAVGSGITFQIMVEVVESNPLPVTLIDFKGTPSRDGILLTWTTTEEINNSHFELHRGLSPDDMMPVAEIEPLQSDLSIKSYSYLDEGLDNGYYYYQLKNIDLDGKTELFNIIGVKYVLKDRLPEFHLYPNPVTGNHLVLETKNLNVNKANLMLLDPSGRRLASWETDDLNYLRLSLPQSIRSGVYFLTVHHNLSAHTLKLIIP